MLHYLQEIKSKKFQQFDEGTDTANRRRYGSPSPPEYDLTKVKVPIYLHFSHNDYLSEVAVRCLITTWRIFAKIFVILGRRRTVWKAGWWHQDCDGASALEEIQPHGLSVGQKRQGVRLR